MSVLEARGLSVGYGRGEETLTAVAELSLSFEPGTILGLAGESGAGKSTLALALVGFLAPGAGVLDGGVHFGGVELTRATAATRRRLWGAELAYLPQDCATALNPALRVGGQLAEAMRAHLALGRGALRARALRLLEQVGLAEPAAVLGRYPHELSGGEQQRVALALAVCCDPRVLILDEPTSGLDGRSQRRVLGTVAALARERGTATLLVSHDLRLLAGVCDELAVMYAGRIVERGPAVEVFAAPVHPYTTALLAAIPAIAGERAPRGLPGSAPLGAVADRCGFVERCPLRLDDCLQPVELAAAGRGRWVRCIRAGDARGVLGGTPDGDDRRRDVGPPADTGTPLLAVAGLRCRYGDRVALDGVSFALAPGAVLGVAGESGAGKTTLLRSVAGLQRGASGRISLAGTSLALSVSARTREQLGALQVVLQNPDSTLNPRHTVSVTLGRPLRLFRPEIPRSERRAAAAAALARVELPSRLLDRLPRELSAGQRQRVALARALVPRPRVLLCDEPTSALDVSAQAAVLELLHGLRQREGLALVVVTHDLGVLRHLADDIVVLERGSVVERGPALEVLRRPRHPSTSELIAALPDPRPAAR